MQARVHKKDLDPDIMLDTFLNSTEECIIFVDKNGYIEVLSKAYAEFLQVNLDQVIGKHVTDVIENTRMHIVIKTGVSEIAQTQVIRGESMIASRIPIFRGGEIVGAFGRVLFKNIGDLNELYEKINNMEQEVSLYKQALSGIHRPKFSVDDIITENAEMMRLKGIVGQVSKTNSGILLLGESGTGKELFAHAIHHSSKRAQKPFICINCAAIPPELLEAELFGYEPGAFTGASRSGKIGLFKAADRGTIFLDEIGEMPIHLQVKLLRFLQDKEVKKVGATTYEKVDVRIIAATNRDLPEMISQGRFRSDLYYRLSVIPLHIPPLRERREDIPVLSRYLVQKICDRERLRNVTISREAISYMQSYDWPGNVRELENVLESAINFLGADKVIGPDKLPSRVTGSEVLRPAEHTLEFAHQDLKSALDNYEKELIIHAMHVCGRNRTKAARLLGISRTNLYEKIERFGISTKRKEGKLYGNLVSEI